MTDNIIIHHWDTDGICSAAIVAMVLEKKGESWRNYTLQIGKFEFDERVIREINGADTVYVVDLNMLDAVEKLSQRVIFIDHHIQKRITNPNVKQINPIIPGRGEKEFPSATWVVSHHFSIWNYLSALGAVGDVGSSIFDWQIGKKVEELLNKEGLSKDDAVHSEYGVFALHTPEMGENRVVNSTIYDFAPTILRLFGINDVAASLRGVSLI